MTKVGEKGNHPKEPEYHKELEAAIHKFLKALESHHASKTKEDRSHYRAVMDREFGLMDAAIKEIGRFGMHKRESLLENSYKAYLEKSSTDNLFVLKDSICILREDNRAP